MSALHRGQWIQKEKNRMSVQTTLVSFLKTIPKSIQIPKLNVHILDMLSINSPKQIFKPPHASPRIFNASALAWALPHSDGWISVPSILWLPCPPHCPGHQPHHQPGLCLPSRLIAHTSGLPLGFFCYPYRYVRVTLPTTGPRKVPQTLP